MHWGGNISKVIFDIGDELLEDLKRQALKNDSSPEDFIKYCIQQELRDDNMLMVALNEDVMEKVNIKCKLSNKTPEEVVNDVLWDQLRKIEDVSDDFDGDKLWNMLDHDKAEGDDILDRITDMFD